MTKCILDTRRKGGCASCDGLCSHRIALHGFDGKSGRVGAAGVPADYQYLTLANSPAREGQPKLYDKLDVYAKTFQRPFTGDPERIKSWYFWSESPGTGKTTTAVTMLNEFIATHYAGSLLNGKSPKQKPAMFLAMNELQRKYNMAVMTDDKELMMDVRMIAEEAARAPFVVIDDLGVRATTDAFNGIVYSILDLRTTSGLPTIFTANFPLSEVKTKYDSKIYDRMRDMCFEHNFAGESHRGKKRR